MSIDLLSVPQGYKTNLALIIAPYMDTTFISAVAKQMRPQLTRIIIDDGTRRQDIDNIRACFGPRANVKIFLGAAPGLVHIKGYYFSFIKAEGRARRRRRFIFGSANATEAGFSGRKNAELIAELDVSLGQDQEVIRYISSILEKMESGGGTVDGVTIEQLKNPPKLLLPSFRITALGPPPGFDAWLQRGLLAAKYRDAQNFLVINVKLKKRMPQDLVARTFANRGLMEQGSRDNLRYAYIRNDASEPTGETTTPMWKARHCVWTHLGDWLSDDCYQTYGREMKSENSATRAAKLDQLLKNGHSKSWRSEQKSAFLSTLAGVWDDLRQLGQAPEEYLDTADGRLDSERNGERFDKKVAADLRMAEDEHFKNRYTLGYEFPPVPKFRQDAEAWDAFTSSWCESILFESKKAKRFSLATKAVSEAVEADGSVLQELVHGELLAFLREKWNVRVTVKKGRLRVAEIVADYFQLMEDEDAS